MKKVLIVLGVLLVVAVAATLLVLANLDEIVKRAIESVGSRATGTTVTVEHVQISLGEGRATIRGLVIGNPEGFETASAIRLEETTVAIDTGTIGDDTLVIRTVVIAGPEVTYEFSGSGSNIARIQENVKAFAASFGGGGGAPAEESPVEEGGGQKMIIEDLQVREGRVSLSATLLQGQEAGVTLPPTQVKDIGKAEGGATPGEVASEVLLAITGDIIDAARKFDLGAMKDDIEKTADDVKDRLGGLFGK